MKVVIGLIATRPREASLLGMSVPSISRQSDSLDALVIVSDRYSLTTSTEAALQALLPRTCVHSIRNHRRAGAAGAWNTGLTYIQKKWPDAYVAILDDDDTWDPDHIAACMDTASQWNWPDVVVSGLRMNMAGTLVSRPPPMALNVDDFLAGNPGWQGSNTFAGIAPLMRAGGFTDTLTSCNDRDLAIRVLSLSDVRVAYTERFTATWNFNTSPDCLSQAGPQKRDALRHFLVLHGHRMSAPVRERFLTRCMDLFGVSEADLV